MSPILAPPSRSLSKQLVRSRLHVSCTYLQILLRRQALPIAPKPYMLPSCPSRSEVINVFGFPLGLEVSPPTTFPTSPAFKFHLHPATPHQYLVRALRWRPVLTDHRLQPFIGHRVFAKQVPPIYHPRFSRHDALSTAAPASLKNPSRPSAPSRLASYTHALLPTPVLLCWDMASSLYVYYRPTCISSFMPSAESRSAHSSRLIERLHPSSWLLHTFPSCDRPLPPHLRLRQAPTPACARS